MLLVSDQGRRVQVKLLHGVIAADGEEGGGGAVDGKTPDDVECWNGLIGDLLRPDVPGGRSPATIESVFLCL